jgi:hypothetical protein
MKERQPIDGQPTGLETSLVMLDDDSLAVIEFQLAGLATLAIFDPGSDFGHDRRLALRART